MTLLNTGRCIAPNILDLSNVQLTEILLYNKENLDIINNTSIDIINNTSILDATIKYLIETKRFDTQYFLSSPDFVALTLILLLKFIFSLFLFLFCFYSYYYLFIIFRVSFAPKFIMHT